MVYAVDVILWILRILEMFAANKHLGPYVVMIGKMVGLFITLVYIFHLNPKFSLITRNN